MKIVWIQNEWPHAPGLGMPTVLPTDSAGRPHLRGPRGGALGPPLGTLRGDAGRGVALEVLEDTMNCTLYILYYMI